MERICEIRKQLQEAVSGSAGVCFSDKEDIEFLLHWIPRPNLFVDSEWFESGDDGKVPSGCYGWKINDHEKETLIHQLQEAIEVVREMGEDSFICDGLRIAVKIVEAGPNADAKSVAREILEGFGI